MHSQHKISKALESAAILMYTGVSR